MAYCGGTREWDTTKTNPETEPRMASAEGRSELLTAKDRSGSRPPKCRVAEELARTRREIATRCRFEDLPAAIRLTPGELRITFSGAEDLAAKLVELSQAMSHDWSGFIRAVEE